MKNKFRVWCKNRNEWERNETYIDQNGDLWCWQSNRLITVRKETHTIEQCTGLKDKNDKLIYEGDILSFTVFDYNDYDTQYTGVVVCHGSRHTIWNNPDSEYYGSDGGFDLDWVIGQDCEIEIIGNIHDNPKLLEVE